MAFGDYLRGVLADGARPFRYRGGVRELLGLPDDTGVPVSFGARLPAAAFTYLRAPDAFPVEDAPPEWLAAPDAGWFDEPGTASAASSIGSTAPETGPSPQSTVDASLTIPGSTPRPAGDAHWSALPDRRPDAARPPVTATSPDPGRGVAGPATVPARPNPTGPRDPAEATGVSVPGVAPAAGRQPGAGRYGDARRSAGTAGASSPRGAEPPAPAFPGGATGDSRAPSRPASADPGAGTGATGAGAPAADSPAAPAGPPAPSGGMPRRTSARGAFPHGPATGARFTGTGTGSGPGDPGTPAGPGELAGGRAPVGPPPDGRVSGGAAPGSAEVATGRDSAATPPRGGSAVRPIPTTVPSGASRKPRAGAAPARPVRTPPPGAEDSGTGESDEFEPPYRRTGQRHRAAPQPPAAPEPPAAPPAAPPPQVLVIRQAAPPVVSTAAFWERRYVGRLRARILR